MIDLQAVFDVYNEWCIYNPRCDPSGNIETGGFAKFDKVDLIQQCMYTDGL